MSKQIPLVCKHYILEKFNGKGGWTFVRIPEIVPSKNTPFGWVKVSGTIDDFEFSNYNLQSMGNGMIFLPIKAQIRKVINKKEGDHVFIVLYQENSSINIPIELSFVCWMNLVFLTFFQLIQKPKRKRLLNGSMPRKRKKLK